jgi:hypothetical protein
MNVGLSDGESVDALSDGESVGNSEGRNRDWNGSNVGDIIGASEGIL